MRSWRAVLFLLAFAPALVTALLVARHAVDVPVWDDLERAALLEKWSEGTLGFRDLYSLHIEHRIVVTRLITLVGAKLAHGSLVFEHACTFAMVLATALLVHGLLRRTLGPGTGGLYGLTFLANLLLFSPLQWETFLWAIQTAFVVPPLCLVAGLLVLQTGLSRRAKLILCGLAALVATHSFSHGLLLWGALPAAFLLHPRSGPARGRALWVAAWLLLCAAVLVPYFTVGGFRNESDHAYVEVGEAPHGLALATLPGRAERAVRFQAALLGSPLARTAVVEPRQVAPWAGGLVGALFALAAAYALVRRRDRRLFERCLPWLVLGGFAVLACSAAAMGRTVALKWTIALLPHYLTLSTYVLLSTLVLGALVARDLRGRVGAPRAASRWLLESAPGFLAGLLVAFQGLQYLIGAAGMAEWESARLQARTSILFINHFEPRESRRLDGIPEVAHRLLNRLDRAGYLHPPLFEDTRLAHFAIAEGALAARDARIVEAKLAGPELLVRGFAWLPEAGRRADGVLLSIRDAGGERRVVALAELEGLPHVAVAEADHIFNALRLPNVESFSPWETRLRLSRLPHRGELELEAWAVDSRRMRVQPLAQRLVLRRAGARPAVEVVEAGGPAIRSPAAALPTPHSSPPGAVAAAPVGPDPASP